MSTRPPARYRKSIRLPQFDYAGNATFFITICTWQRKPLFGDIVDGRMILNRYGEIATIEWLQSAEIRTELDLHHMVVMPNHLHGLVTITPAHRPADAARSTGLYRSPRSLGSFVDGFKSAVTRRINDDRGTLGARVWQPNYHEHIVRNEASFDTIWEYIEHNPAMWHDDGENPESPKFRHGT